MAANDLKIFQNNAAQHARDLKNLVTQGQELLSYWQKLDLSNDANGIPGEVLSPLVKADLANYVNLCSALVDFCDNVQVSAGDRRGVIERVGTQPISA